MGRKPGSSKPRQRKDVNGNLIDLWEVLVNIRNKLGESKRIPIYGSTYEECEQNKLNFIASLPPEEYLKDRITPKVDEAIQFFAKAHKPKTRKNGEGTIFQRSSDGLWVARVPTKINADGSLHQIQVTAKTQNDLRNKVKQYEAFSDGIADEIQKKNLKTCFDKLLTLISGESEENAVSIERKPIDDRPRFEKLKETADLLETGYDEFVSNLKKPEIQALSVLTKVNISPSDEYLEILKGLPQSIRNLAEELEKSDKLAVYENWANDSLRYLKAAGKI